MIDHLLRLPLGLIAALSGNWEPWPSWKIRNFLTGQALTAILDAVFGDLHPGDGGLQLVADADRLSVLPIQVGLTVLGAPLFRRQSSAEEHQDPESLVEVSRYSDGQGPERGDGECWRWQEFYSAYIAKTFEKTITGTALTQTSQVLQKISQLMVLGGAFGAAGELPSAN